MLPFHDSVEEHRFHEHEPERRLCAAILIQAWKDAKHSTSKPFKRSHLTRRARFYIASDDTEPFSFVWICQVLDIDPVAARESLAKDFKAASERRKKRLKGQIRSKKFVFIPQPEQQEYIPSWLRGAAQ